MNKMTEMTDIVIRGISMPKYHSLWLLIKPDGTVFKIKGNDKMGLPEEGTAIFLPEGHGDLIDRDAIRKEIDDKRPGRIYEDGWALTVMDNAPTIVPKE